MTVADGAPGPRSQPVQGSRFVHELALLSSADEVVRAAVRFVLEGRAAGEPTLVNVPPDTAAALLDRVGGEPGVTVLPPEEGPRRPARDLAKFRRLAQESLTGAKRVRIFNQMAAAPDDWHQWSQYEAAVNLALADLELIGLCSYDRSRLDAAMVEDLSATHPFVWDSEGYEPNPGYQDPVAFGATHFDALPDPIEATEPAVDLVDPAAADVRAAVRRVAGSDESLSGEDVEGLVFAVNEAFTNAVVHGQPPVRLRVWTAGPGAVATVTDTGQGPKDCFVGLLPSHNGEGLWLSHHLVDIAHRRDAGGYTVRLSAVP